MKNASKKGFTLAEVLLTLVIVGAIYAVLSPALQHFMPDKYQTLYKKSYHNLTSSIRYSFADGSLSVAQTPLRWADPDVVPSITTLTFCQNISRNLSTVGNVLCPINGSLSVPNFTLEDGSRWWGLGGFKFDKTTNTTRDIYVDLDGLKGKNTLGVDQLRFRVSYDGKVTIDENWPTEYSYLFAQ